MPGLYITSTETFAGESALSIGLATRFIHDGLAIGYMKPISRAVRLVAGRLIDEDVQFIKEEFGLPDAMDLLMPVALTPNLEEAILRGKEKTDFLRAIKDAYQQLREGRDVILLEAGTNFREGSLIGLTSPDMADALGVRELLVVRHSENLVDDILSARHWLGPSLIGIVINAVPRQHRSYVEDVVRPYMENQSIPILGVLPEERLLQSISVRELAQILAGEILCCPDKDDELVEHFMVGAMSVDSALAYFRRKPNKAVITGGDRPDIQLAALETSTRCLILTGNLRPSQVILERARSVNVPIILAEHDTLTTVKAIEDVFGKTRFHQKKKIQRFVRLMEGCFDYERLYRALELAPGRGNQSAG
jgi:uncharacterized protein